MKHSKRYTAIILSCITLVTGCANDTALTSIGQSIQEIVDGSKNNEKDEDGYTEVELAEDGSFKIREDSENAVTFQENVVMITQADSSNNIEINQLEHTITISDASKELDDLEEDGILYILPGETFSDGLVAKVTSIDKGTNEVTLTCEEPSISEVFESIDISTQIPVSAVSDDDGGLKFAHNDGSYFTPETYDGRTWFVSAWEEDTTTFTIETPDYDKKDGVYGHVEFTLTIDVDFQMVTEGTDISRFNLVTYAESGISCNLGYNKSANTEQKIELATCTIPLTGPLVMNIAPYLIVRANGEISVDANASVSNLSGFALSNTYGFKTIDPTPTTTADFSASAEGSVEGGIGVEIGLGLAGLSFFDDMDLAYADITVGLVIDGSTNVFQNLSVTGNSVDYSGNQNTPDELGRLHTCYICFQGECNDFIDLTLGLNQKLEKLLQKLNSDISLTYSFDREKDKIYDWHYSTGDGYSDEFEFTKCPHMAYEVTVATVQKDSHEPVSGINVSVGNQDSQRSDSDGETKWYLPSGDYKITASSSKCNPSTVTQGISVGDISDYVMVEVEVTDEELPYCVYGSSIAEYKGKLYGGEVFEKYPYIPEYNGYQRTSSANPNDSRYSDLYPDYVAFYGDKIYYSYYFGGSSPDGTELYSCNLDGTDVTLIDGNDVYRDRAEKAYDIFVICDGKLYYDNGSKYVNLETGNSGASNASRLDSRLIDRYNWRYDNTGGLWYHLNGSSITRGSNGNEETFYTAKNDEHIYSLVAITSDSLFFQAYEYTSYYISDYTKQGADYDYSKEINLHLYRADLNTKTVTEVDSRITGLGEFMSEY